jgi:hypothetical protein
MINNRKGNNDVIYSPELGFWGENGWSWSLDKADKISSKTKLVLGFTKKTKAKRISLSHCLILDKCDLGVMVMEMAISLLLKNKAPAILNAILSETSVYKGEVYIKAKDGTSAGPLAPHSAQLRLGIRYFEGKPKTSDVVELAKNILPIDANICSNGKILIVHHGGERTFELAPCMDAINIGKHKNKRTYRATI